MLPSPVISGEGSECLQGTKSHRTAITVFLGFGIQLPYGRAPKWFHILQNPYHWLPFVWLPRTVIFHLELQGVCWLMLDSFYYLRPLINGYMMVIPASPVIIFVSKSFQIETTLPL